MSRWQEDLHISVVFCCQCVCRLLSEILIYHAKKRALYYRQRSHSSFYLCLVTTKRGCKKHTIDWCFKMMQNVLWNHENPQNCSLKATIHCPFYFLPSMGNLLCFAFRGGKTLKSLGVLKECCVASEIEQVIKFLAYNTTNWYPDRIWRKLGAWLISIQHFLVENGISF